MGRSQLVLESANGPEHEIPGPVLVCSKRVSEDPGSGRGPGAGPDDRPDRFEDQRGVVPRRHVGLAIEQAKGVISERAAVTMDEAFARLRSYARSHNLKLSSLAASLVERNLTETQLAEITQSSRTAGHRGGTRPPSPKKPDQHPNSVRESCGCRRLRPPDPERPVSETPEPKHPCTALEDELLSFRRRCSDQTTPFPRKSLRFGGRGSLDVYGDVGGAGPVTVGQQTDTNTAAGRPREQHLLPDTQNQEGRDGEIRMRGPALRPRCSPESRTSAALRSW